MMQVSGFYRDLPTLETPRLILRKMTLADASDIFAYASDAAVARYLRWGPHPTLAQTESYVRGVLQEYLADRDGPWGIVSKSTHRMIGHIHLMDMSAQHRKAEIGFVLAQSWWNKGLATEAFAACFGPLF